MDSPVLLSHARPAMADLAIRVVDKKYLSVLKKMRFLRFAQKICLKILLAGSPFYRTGLFDGESLKEPPVLLPGERAYFGRIPRPLKSPAVEPFVQDHKSSLVVVEGFDTICLSPAEEVQRVSKRIHGMGIADD